MDRPHLFTLFLQERYDAICHLFLIFRQLLVVTGPIFPISSAIGSRSPEGPLVIGVIDLPPVFARSPLFSSEMVKKKHVIRSLLGAIFVGPLT
jgi:hypothetical protein